MSSPPPLLIVVLNFRTAAITIDCLHTLAAEYKDHPEFHVALIDNASGDDSVPKIRAAIAENGWAEWITFEALDKNLGFAGGNNYVLRNAMELANPPQFFLLLNSDTLVRKGCLRYCVQVMEKQSDIGALSCMLLNRDGTVQNVCRKFPTPLRETVRAMGLPWQLPSLFSWADLEDRGWDRRSGPRDVDWIGGAFLMTRLETLQRAGLMDEGFFFYGEDCEWCFRIWKSGFRVHFDPSVETVHLGGASSDNTRMRNRSRDVHTWRARFRVQRTCYGPLSEGVVRAAYIVQFAFSTAFMKLTGRTDSPKYQNTLEGLRQLTGPLDP